MPHRNTKLKCYFNPRSPCGERRKIRRAVMRDLCISIHAPRAGSDRLRGEDGWEGEIFQSTLPVRGATLVRHVAGIGNGISIHAPRAGSDDICEVS